MSDRSELNAKRGGLSQLFEHAAKLAALIAIITALWQLAPRYERAEIHGLERFQQQETLTLPWSKKHGSGYTDRDRIEEERANYANRTYVGQHFKFDVQRVEHRQGKDVWGSPWYRKRVHAIGYHDPLWKSGPANTSAKWLEDLKSANRRTVGSFTLFFGIAAFVFVLRQQSRQTV